MHYCVCTAHAHVCVIYVRTLDASFVFVHHTLLYSTLLYSQWYLRRIKTTRRPDEKKTNYQPAIIIITHYPQMPFLPSVISPTLRAYSAPPPTAT